MWFPVFPLVCVSILRIAVHIFTNLKAAWQHRMFAGPVSYVTENMRFMQGHLQVQKQRLLHFLHYFRMMHTHTNVGRPSVATRQILEATLSYTGPMMCFCVCMRCRDYGCWISSSFQWTEQKMPALNLNLLWYGVHKTTKHIFIRILRPWFMVWN